MPVLVAPGGRDSVAFPLNSGEFEERTLISNQFWGERSKGEWSIEVLDTNPDGDRAQIQKATLYLWDMHQTITIERDPIQ